MTLKDLFNKINQLNKINKDLGVELRYGIKVSTYTTYKSMDFNSNTYTNINNLIKDVEEESYYTDIDKEEITILENALNLLDLDIKVTFRGSNKFNEHFEECYDVFIMEIL